MSSVRTALIVGAGVAGPACALALHRIGVRATVVESHPGPDEGVGAIITLAENGLDVLRTLDADAPVMVAAQPITEIQMADAAGRAFARHPGGGQLLPRDALARALADRAVQAGVSIRYGRRLTNAERDADGITAFFADGSTESADLLIGADGIHSTVRTVIDPGAPRPVYEGVLGFGAMTDGSDVSAAPGVMNFAFGHRFLGYWRTPEGRICWYAALPYPEELTWHQLESVPKAEWLVRLRAEYIGHVPGEQLLARTAPEDLMTTGPTLRMPSLPHWSDNRVVLVGDSAHGPSSSSGQGAALALESAVELARCIRDVPDLDDALIAYESLRRPRVEAIAAMAAAANRNKAGKAPDAPTAGFDPTRHHIAFDATVPRRSVTAVKVTDETAT